MSKKIVILGTAHPLRGGLASFNERLAKAYMERGDEVVIHNFSLQYPDFLFPGKTQYTTDPAPPLNIKNTVNSINPFNWIKAAGLIADERPDILITRFWLPFMGPCLGTIVRMVKWQVKTTVIAIIDNIIPHERRPGDHTFTQYFVNSIDGFVVMSRAVGTELLLFNTSMPVRQIPHPLYDTYGELVEKEKARKAIDLLPPNQKYILFFGFIRDYKGLDLLLEAMADSRIRQLDINLVVAGEFYNNEDKYHQLIAKLGIADLMTFRTYYIPSEEVKYYFCAADLVVQPYKTATQSGISKIGYHFNKPMLVTNVGGLPELVSHKKTGYVVDITPKAIADAIVDYYEKDREGTFIEGVKVAKKRFSWAAFTDGIDQLVEQVEWTVA